MTNPSIYAGLSEWIKEQMFIETILHELLHVKHPEWDEEKIRDESARIIGEDLEKIVTNNSGRANGMVKCGDCRHYKDRYTLFMHGGFPDLKKLLELNLIDEKDFLCEGWGCVFHPNEDFAHDEYDEPIKEEDFEDIKCEHFEPLHNRKELAKNIYRYGNWENTHLDISDI